MTILSFGAVRHVAGQASCCQVDINGGILQKENKSMAVDITEKKATLKVSRSNDGFTEVTMFRFALPVSVNYEITFSETINAYCAFTKYFTNGIDIKYNKEMLHLEIECTKEHGFYLEVKDSERKYKARRYYWDTELTEDQDLEVEGIEVHFIEGQEK
jgi:hypothetical protein